MAAEREWRVTTAADAAYAFTVSLPGAPRHGAKTHGGEHMNHYGIDDCTGPLFAAPARAPAVQTSRTSMLAADGIGPRLNDLQCSVVAYLRQAGEHGATDEEIAAGLGMNPSTQRPRRIELVRRGLVVEAGTRKTKSGRYATAWRLA